MEKFYGLYRGIVVENNVNDNNYGAIRVFIPYLMDNKVLQIFQEEEENEEQAQLKQVVQESENEVESFETIIEEDKPITGLIAYPASFPLGGYNLKDEESFFLSSVLIPAKGSYVWVFFENGDINKPFYINAVILNSAKLPPENRGVKDPAKVYTLIKTKKGRSIILSDSADVARVEITGRRRLIKKGLKDLPEDEIPAGSPEASYEIPGNMNTILIEETSEGEQILIQTYRNDFIRIDIQNRSLDIKMGGDIKIHASGDMYINALGKLVLDANHIIIQSDSRTVLMSEQTVKVAGGKDAEISAHDSISMYNSTGEVEYGYYSGALEKIEIEDIRPVVRYSKPNPDAEEEDKDDEKYWEEKDKENRLEEEANE